MPRYRLRDLLVVVLVIAVLLSVGLPLIQRAREESRRAACSNNGKQIALALHNYHSAYKLLPAAMGGTADNEYRLSGLVALSPFLEYISLWEEISNPLIAGNRTYPAMGPTPTDTSYPPWKEKVGIYYCPSDAGWDDATGPGFGQSNYTFCIGDSARNIHPPKSKDQVRGMLSPRIALRFRDMIDGLSNTVMGDGAVQFISNPIDTGDLSATPPTSVEDDQGNPIRSPYGVWGTVGTRASTERYSGF